MKRLQIHPGEGANSAREIVDQAKAFALPLLQDGLLESGEPAWEHAGAVAAIVAMVDPSPELQAAAYLVYAAEHLSKPREVIAKAFGDSLAGLSVEARELIRVQRQARDTRDPRGGNSVGNAQQQPESVAAQTENVRKMLLAFSRDLRVIVLRLASRLQSLRYYAATKLPVPPSLARESLEVFAPLANRLGIWQIKWELEDLAFRFLEPETYKDIARRLDSKRTVREAYVEQIRSELQRDLAAQGIDASVAGRPKHIYSIVKKMRGKSLAFEQVMDVRALRIVVPEVQDCYATLDLVHSRFTPILREFDDYIARPKPNGYQSLHTVVRDASELPIEVQIRTRKMHEHAENGVAAHWAYKEAGAKGYDGVSAASSYDAKIAVLRQLLAWERDLTDPLHAQGLFDDRIYVLTPDAAVVELTQGATPVDFAYAVHTNLGHRCRGARIDGAMVPLNTALRNGQTVEILAAKESAGQVGPSRDWLNPELGFLASARARAKVRAWFNAQHMHETVARGREAVERLLAREGRTAIKLEDLAAQLGFKSADALFEVVGKDEYSLRNVELQLRPPEPVLPQDEFLLLKKSRAAERHPRNRADSGVLVVGVGSLLTQLAKCCRPALGDDIRGFVTRGKGVSIHRADCANFRELAARSADRVIPVAWGGEVTVQESRYPVDIGIEASDRVGLIRDISEVFAKEKLNVIGVQTQSVRHTAWMTFTVEVADAQRITQVLHVLALVPGVRRARRR